jgi:inner membrane protein
MDNLTHTLIGVVAGDAIARSTADVPGGLSAATRRSYIVTVAAIASNIPDLDLVITYGGLAPGKLGYLLHHRGHTHTIIGCIVLALLLYGCAERWARLRGHRFLRPDRLGIAAATALGALLHLLMDGLNSYGVHPYWPLDNRWVYGDAVFIIEPLYWLAAIGLIFTVRTWAARIVLALAGVAALGIAAVLNREHPLWVAGIVFIAVGLLMMGRRASPRAVALASLAAMLGVTTTFVASGRTTAGSAADFASTTFPGYRTLDLVLTPVATNPLCWDMLLIQRGGERYIVRHGLVATAPSVLAAEDCPRIDFGAANTAPMGPVPASSTSTVQWFGEFVMEEATLADLIGRSCEAREFMQFARAPFVVPKEEAQVLGDLRFDRQPELGFAEIELPNPPSRQCRFHVPWIPPRLSLLRSLQRAGEAPGS